MPNLVSGTFEVKLTPQPPGESPLGRIAIDKRFSGGIVGIGKGEMLAAMTPVEGSAGYVALERVEGSLDGRTGTFVLQHSGTMDRGAQRLSITVVPDSGTDDLAGLTGTMSLQIEAGVHAYTFEYALG